MMTIILFLVDTSASMNQRTYLGTTMLDVAKAAVENFMKIRARDPNSRWDRYMLLTFEDPPANVKAGWKESAVTFSAELKNLKAGGLSSLGPSLKNAFDLLNLFRMQTGVDTYGQGRCPFYLESAVIIVITDGGPLTTHASVTCELNLPMLNVVPGSELTKEPFRWDQRVFGLVLRLPASVPPDVTNFPYIPTADNSPIDSMCDVTGGRSYAVYSQKMMTGALESLVQKVHSGVVINFEKFGPDPPPVPSEGLKTENGEPNGPTKENQDWNKQSMDDCGEDKRPVPAVAQPSSTAWHQCTRLIYVPRSAAKGHFNGHWPIPESFWPDLNSPTLPSRTAHPQVLFSCAPAEPMLIENIPFDKYELEPSPLTQYILERRQPNVCWQTYVAMSGRFSDQALPFGYLKASSSLTAVNLFVMPYNYPVLLPLLDELFKVHKLKPNQQWRDKMEKYLKSMPGYYAAPLRRALAKLGAPNLISDTVDNCLSYSVITYLKKLKNQAKVEMDRMNASVGQKVPLHNGIPVNCRTKTSVLQRRDFSQLLSSLGGNLLALNQETQSDYSKFYIAVSDPSVRPQCYRNPYDIPRKNLLDQVTRMRKNLLQTSHTTQTLMEQEERHNVPVQQMGNYQEQLKKQPPALRPIDNQPARLHMFGNPFKVNKQNMMVDEAEDALFGNQALKRKTQEAPMSPAPDRKRKPGPLPRSVPYRVLASPQRSPLPDHYYISDEEESTSMDEERPMEMMLEDGTEEEQADAPGSMPTPSSPLPSLGEAAVTGDNKAVTHWQSSPPLHLHLTNHNHSSGGVQVNSNGESGGYGVLNHRPGSRAMTVSHKEVVRFNIQLRAKVCKEVKKPGKDFSTLFRQLSLAQGSLAVRRAFVQAVTHEAMRFKRKALVMLLKKFEDRMVREDHRNSRGRSCVS